MLRVLAHTVGTCRNPEYCRSNAKTPRVCSRTGLWPDNLKSHELPRLTASQSRRAYAVPVLLHCSGSSRKRGAAVPREAERPWVTRTMSGQLGHIVDEHNVFLERIPADVQSICACCIVPLLERITLFSWFVQIWPDILHKLMTPSCGGACAPL